MAAATGSRFNQSFSCAGVDPIRADNNATNGDMLRAIHLTAFATRWQAKVWVGGCAADGVSTIPSVLAE